MTDAHAWVDGSGHGGWGAVIVTDDKFVHVLARCKGPRHSTRMELQAAIGALRYLAPCEVRLYTDQAAIVDRVGRWIRTGVYDIPEESRDADLWREFRAEFERHKSVTVCKVRSGHDAFHNIAHGLASSAAALTV